MSGSIRGAMESLIQVCDSLFQGEWFANSRHMSRAVLNSDQDRASRGVGEGNNGLEETGGRR